MIVAYRTVSHPAFSGVCPSVHNFKEEDLDQIQCDSLLGWGTDCI